MNAAKEKPHKSVVSAFAVNRVIVAIENQNSNHIPNHTMDDTVDIMVIVIRRARVLNVLIERN